MNNKLIRVNKKGETFKNKFYIIDKTSDTRGEWWILRLKSSHFTLVAVESKEKLFSCLHNLIFKYKNYDKFTRVLKGCERELHNKDSYEKMTTEYKDYKGSDLYAELEDFIRGEEELLHTNNERKRKGASMRKMVNVPATKKAPKKNVAKKTSAPLVKKKKKKKIHLLK